MLHMCRLLEYRVSSLALCASIACLHLACSSDSGDATAAGSGGSSTSGTAAGGAGNAPEEVIGTFQIELKSAMEATDTTDAKAAYTSIVGRVYEYPAPQDRGWALVEEQGGCQLLKPTFPFCDPSCTGGAICADGDECVPYPDAYDLGDVTLSGIATESGSDSFTMGPLPPSNTYQPLASVGVAYPPFAEGDNVQLSVSEGELGAFDITTTGIRELVLTAPEDVVPFVPDESVVLEWEAPQDPSASMVQVTADISHHGGQKGEIRCSVPDNGSLELDAALVTGLIDLGFSGFPTVTVTRITSGEAQTPKGRVRLTAIHSVVRPIEIPGLVSCPESGMTDGCPEGQICQADLRCE